MNPTLHDEALSASGDRRVAPPSSRRSQTSADGPLSLHREESTFERGYDIPLS